MPFPLGEQIHKFVPGDQVWSKPGNTTPWPHIGRVHTLALSSPTAVKVADVTPWILHRRVKRAYSTDLEDAEWTTQKDPADPHEPKSILRRRDEALQLAAATRTCWYHLETNHSFSTKRDMRYN